MSDDPEAELVAVFDKYDLPEPRHGEHPMKCPVHEDSIASASVNREKGMWYCHACGAGGGAVSLVVALESVDFPEARRIVNGLVGGSTPRTGAMQGVRRKRSTGRWVPPSLRRAM